MRGDGRGALDLQSTRKQRQTTERADSLNLEMRGEPAPARDSGNVTAWEQHFDVALVVANCLVLLVTSVVGFAANVFVLVAVCRQKSLQTPVNALVVNLAVVDFLRCVIDCPVLLNVVATAHQRGSVDSRLCETQMASFSFSCCVQLSTLACISAERYQAIAKPFEASQRRRRIMTLIPLTWTLAVLVAVVCQVFLKDSPVYMRCQELLRGTSLSYDTFGLYVLLPLWTACFGLITGFYVRIFALVRSHNRKIFDKGISVPKRSPTEDKQKGEDTDKGNGCSKSEPEQNPSISDAQTQVGPNRLKKKSQLTWGEALQCESISSERKTEHKNTAEMSHLETDQPHPLALNVEKPIKAEQCSPVSIKTETQASNQDAAANVQGSNTATQKVSSNSNSKNPSGGGLKPDTFHAELTEQRQPPESASFLMTDLKQEDTSTRGETLTSDQTPSTPADPNNEALKQCTALEGAVCIMPSKASKERARKRKESQMAKRAGYIILTFLLFWLPQITWILVNALVHKNMNPQKRLIQDMEILSVSVTCVTSLSDPIIYAAVNPQFRSEFYRLKSWVQSRFNKNS